MMAVYTGFAIVLTTLIWVYLSWLILLIGAQLAFYVQFPQYLRHGHDAAALDGSAREQLGLSVDVSDRARLSHRHGALDAPRLAPNSTCPALRWRRVLACLEEAGLHRRDREGAIPAGARSGGHQARGHHRCGAHAAKRRRSRSSAGARSHLPPS